PHEDLHRREPERALRGDVVGAFGGSDRLGNGRGDEALDHVGAGAGIGCGDGDHRLVDLGILPDRHGFDALHPNQQDQEAYDGREERPQDEDFGETHCAAPAVDAILLGSTLLSMATLLPFDSLFWPEVTICMPGVTPFLISISDSDRRPISTKTCLTTYCGPGGGCGAPGAAAAWPAPCSPPGGAGCGGASTTW